MKQDKWDTHDSSAVLVAEDPPDRGADRGGEKHTLRAEGKIVTSSNFHQNIPVGSVFLPMT